MGRLVIAPAAKWLVIPIAVLMVALAGCGSTRSAARSGVVIPGVQNQSLERGYATLRAKGFRVSVSGPFTLNGYTVDSVSKTIPPAGTRAERGSIVTLVPGSGPVGSPVGVLHPKHYRLPDLIGRPLPVASRWLDRHWAFRSIHFSRLNGSTAPNLFAAYVVTTQRPAAGSNLSEDGRLDLSVRPRR